VSAAFLVYRKLREAKIASTLKIESVQGVVEERFVSIGGIDQWISIRGEDQSNPVLLVIHGGPGSCYSIFTPHLRGWEKHSPSSSGINAAQARPSHEWACAVAAKSA
jgi:hypothetical protein